MNQRLRSSLLVLSAAASVSLGCSDTVEPDNRLGVVRASLTKAESCEDLERMIKNDALAKMNARIDAELSWIESDWGYADDSAMPGSTGSGGAAAGGAGGSAGSGQNAAEDPEAASEFSGTNTQVDGVDEADIVKTDGKYIYLLHGEQFLVLNAWPSTELAQSASFSVEGMPLEMYVTDEGKVVIYSIVEGNDVYTAAGVSPRSAYDDGYYYGGAGVPEPYYPGYYAHPLTKITVLQLDQAQPSIVNELYFEGTYASSRRVGQHVRTIVQGGAYGPELRYWVDDYPSSQAGWKAAYEKLRAENTAKILNSTLADWLPYYMVRTAAGVQANLARCDEFYVPTPGSTTFGMTQIQSLDLADPGRIPRGANIVGATDTVYSTEDTMVLASRAWVDPSVWQGSSGGDVFGPLGAARSAGPVSTSYTHLHSFDLAADPAVPGYTASGTIPGTILNQFSLDVHNGHLRIATTDDRVGTDWDTSRVNHVFVLAAQGEDLVEIGSVRDLAPGERIYSARFLGEKGYLVTFRQVDPLFVLDLANPAAPKVLGELKIPGFSEYMHPLGDDHLLTIGQDEGLAVQIFDVSDPMNPVQRHKHVFSGPDSYGYSEAETNHKAFTYYANRGLLAFPFVGYNSYDYGMRSSLELFRIDAEQGIFPLGSVDHTALFNNDPTGYCGGYYGTSVRRGLFLEDFVYSISYGGVVVNAVDDLAHPVATLALPAPTSAVYGCYY